MSIQNLTVGKVYRKKRNGWHYLCVCVHTGLSSTLVTLETGWTFIARWTEIYPNGLINWAGKSDGHRYGELYHEAMEAKKFFPNGFPWEGKEINGGIDDDDY